MGKKIRVCGNDYVEITEYVREGEYGYDKDLAFEIPVKLWKKYDKLSKKLGNITNKIIQVELEE